MPQGYMDMKEVARYLGLDYQQATKMAQRGEIPCQKISGQYRFNRAAVTEWMQQNLGQGKHNLAKMDLGLKKNEATEDQLIITPLLRIEAISTNLPARTKSSVLRELVGLAQETGLLYDPAELLKALMGREELCSTAMEGGIAIPHPRRPQQYTIAEPILVIARSTQAIGFGAPDRLLTDLFFMTCSQDDKHHLEVLARLCRMLNDKLLAHKIRDAESPQDVLNLMARREKEVLTEQN